MISKLKLLHIVLGTLLFWISTLIPSTVQAQDLPCGTHSLNEEVLLHYPHLLETKEQLEAETEAAKNQKNLPGDFPVKIIPVVFHIVHNFGPENISMAQVRDAVRIINEDFRLLNSDTADVLPFFQSRMADSRFEFALARIDPNGNCTEGVTRTWDPVNANAFAESFKDQLFWPTDKYLNVWVCGANARGAGGYAFYPGRAPFPNREGIVNNARQLGSIGASSGGNFSARTLTHEIGHYFNLPHTWGNSNSPGSQANCTIDDGVDDTPITAGVTGQNCDKTYAPCGVLANVENYMDYSNCGRMFTIGQAQRMQVASNSNAGFRIQLWQPSNLLATGVDTTAQPATCKIQGDFGYDSDLLCFGSSVRLTANAYNFIADSTVTYKWLVPNGVISADSLRVTTVTFNTAGPQTISLVLSSPGRDNDTITKVGVVTVQDTVGQRRLPFAEDFEVPNVTTLINDRKWAMATEPAGRQGFQITADAAVQGTRSIRVDNIANAGIISTLTSPRIDLTNTTGPYNLRFKWAYRQRTTQNNDEMRILFSTNCGQSWSLRQVRRANGIGAVALVTAPLSPAPFVPTSAQWSQYNISFPTVSPSTPLQIRLEVNSDFGNLLYIDDFEINGIVVSLNAELTSGSLKVYPNPVDASSVIKLPSQRGNIRVVSMDGRILTQKAIEAQGQEFMPFNELIANRSAAPGVYMVHWADDASSQTFRIVIK